MGTLAYDYCSSCLVVPRSGCGLERNFGRQANGLHPDSTLLLQSVQAPLELQTSLEWLELQTSLELLERCHPNRYFRLKNSLIAATDLSKIHLDGSCCYPIEPSPQDQRRLRKPPFDVLAKAIATTRGGLDAGWACHRHCGYPIH